MNETGAKTIWVSGAAGRLGSRVCELLRTAGHTVLPADRQGANPVDLTDAAAVARSQVGADAIVHLAAIPTPQNIDPAELVHNNTMACFNALEQAWQQGIRVAVLASSGSIYGTAWAPTPLNFAAVPVDEETPIEYLDPYALTKDFTERMGQLYARRGMTVTALRLHWIMSHDQARDIATRDPDERHIRNLWGYVEIGDAARACVLALQPRAAHQGYEPLVISAAETHSLTPTEVLLSRYLPNIERRASFPGFAGAYDTSRAAAILGWRPTGTWR